MHLAKRSIDIHNDQQSTKVELNDIERHQEEQDNVVHTDPSINSESMKFSKYLKDKIYVTTESSIGDSIDPQQQEEIQKLYGDQNQVHHNFVPNDLHNFTGKI